jgi:hypothetical protein
MLQSTSTAAERRPDRSIAIVDLDIDILNLIIRELLLANYQFLKLTNPWAGGESKTLFPLSLTCKAIRSVVSPWIFHDFIWPGQQRGINHSADKKTVIVEYPTISRNILPHIA